MLSLSPFLFQRPTLHPVAENSQSQFPDLTILASANANRLMDRPAAEPIPPTLTMHRGHFRSDESIAKPRLSWKRYRSHSLNAASCGTACESGANASLALQFRSAVRLVGELAWIGRVAVSQRSQRQTLNVRARPAAAASSVRGGICSRYHHHRFLANPATQSGSPYVWNASWRHDTQQDQVIRFSV